MLIVYQSLESAGTKAETMGTILSGNRFKHETQENASQMYPELDSGTVVSVKTPVFKNGHLEYEVKKTSFANGEASKKLSAQFKKTGDEAQLRRFLTGIVHTIKEGVRKCTERSGTAREPDFIVLGEVHGTDLGDAPLAGYVVMGGINPTGDARHRFTILRREDQTYEPWDMMMYGFEADGLPASENKDEKSICMMVKLRGWVVAFVHAPNAICADAKRVVEYLKSNVVRVTGDEELDLVVGDTNQPSKEFLVNALEGKLGGDKWMGSVHQGTQQVVALGGVDVRRMHGTNSTYHKHYDIACTHHAAVLIRDGEVANPQALDIEPEAAFVFHGLTDKFLQMEDETTKKAKIFAYSDHNGVIVEVLRHKKPLEYLLWQRARQFCKGCGARLLDMEIKFGRHLSCPRPPLAIEWRDEEAPKAEAIGLKRISKVKKDKTTGKGRVVKSSPVGAGRKKS